MRVRTRGFTGARPPGRLRCSAMAARRSPLLLGRAGERGALDRLLENVRGGQSAVLVIRGEAGVGKTALLRYCARQASGFRVARDRRRRVRDGAAVRGAAPAVRADARPARRPAGAAAGRARRGAWACRSGDAARPLPRRARRAEPAGRGRRGAAAAVPRRRRPVARRRLGAGARVRRAPAAGRVGGDGVRRARADRRARSSPACPSSRSAGSHEEDARALLATVVPGRLDDRVRDRLVAETHGNPLAILELPRGLAADAAARRRSGCWRPQALPGGSRRASCGGSTRCPTRRPAAAAVGRPRSRSAIRCSCGARRSASGIDGPRAPRTRPRACSAIGERVTLPAPARALGRLPLGVGAGAPRGPPRAGRGDRRRGRRGPSRLASRRRRRRGPTRRSRPSSSARPAARRRAAGSPRRPRSCARSVALTRDPTRRAERALAAAQASLHAGAFDTALALLAAAEAGPLDELGRARVDLLHAEIAYAQNRGSDAPLLLLRAARTLEPLDVRLARETYLDAWSAALFAGRLATAGGLLDVSRAVRTAPDAAPRRARPTCCSTASPLVFTDGRPAAAPLLQRAPRPRSPGPTSRSRRCCAGAGWPRRRRSWCGTSTPASRWPTAGSSSPASVGALEVLAVSVNVLGQAAALGGDFAARRAADRRGRRGHRGHRSTHVAPYGALVLPGLPRSGGRGRERSSRPRSRRPPPAARAPPSSTRTGPTPILLNALGRYDEALAAAVTASDDTPELFVATWALSELVEAAVRTGNADRARRAPLERLARETRRQRDRLGARASRPAHGRCSPTARPPKPLYREAIERLGARGCARSSPAPTCSTASGCAARAGASTPASSCAPRTSCSSGIGMEAFAERARRELLATGERVRKRAVETRDELTVAGGRRSPGSRATACPTRRSAPGSSSAPARSSGTWARCSPSSGSARAWACTTRCPTWTRRPRPRRCRTSSSRSPTRRTRPRPS